MTADAASPSSELLRGWRLLLACVAGVAFGSVGIAFYSIGAFVDPLGREFGWSRTDVTAALLFSTGIGGLAAPFVGALVERYGARPLALTGLAGVGVAFLLASLNQGSLTLFYLCFVIVATIGSGSGPVSWTRAVAGQFDRHRGFALAIALSGTGIVAILAPTYVTWLIEHFGWRTGFVGVAMLPLLIAFPLAWFFFRPTDQACAIGSVQATGPLPGLTTREAIGSYRFWVLLFSVLTMYLGIAGVVPNLIPALTDKGLAREWAGLAASAFGGAVIVGRVTVGWLIDRYWAPGVAAAILTPAAIGCLLLISEPTIATAILAATLLGVATGAELDLLSFLTTRYFGLRSYSRTYGLLYAGVALAGGFGPLSAAALAERWGSYDGSFAIAAALFVIGGSIVLTLGRYPDLEAARRLTNGKAA